MLLDDNGSQNRDRGGENNSGGFKPQEREDRPERANAMPAAVPFRQTEQREEHPLSRQLKRERFGDSRSSGPRTGAPQRRKPRFNV